MPEEDLQKQHILVAFASIFALISIGTLCYEVLEDWSFIQSFYFSVVTLATVGYGDLHPTNDISRLFTAFYVLIGVSIAVSSLTIIATDRINQAAYRVKKLNKFIRKEKDSYAESDE